MKNLKTLFVACLLMMVSFGVNAQTDKQKAELVAIARQRVQTLSENLKLSEVQTEQIYNIQLLYTEKLFNKMRQEKEGLTLENLVQVMKEQGPDAIEEIKAVLSKKQKKRYEADLKKYQKADMPMK